MTSSRRQANWRRWVTSASRFARRRGGLDPDDDRFQRKLAPFCPACSSVKLTVVIDTEGEFVHDPKISRGPALASEDPDEASAAQQWIQDWIDVADDLGCKLITFFFGQQTRRRKWMNRIWNDWQSGSKLSSAQAGDVKLALRPAAGDVIATVAQFERLKQWLGDTTQLWVAADVGEMLVGGEFPVGDRLARNLDDLACVYLCEPGMNRSHDRRVGHGDVDLSRVVHSLERQGTEARQSYVFRGTANWDCRRGARPLRAFCKADESSFPP